MNLSQINNMKMEMKIQKNRVLMKKLQQTAMKVIMLKPDKLIG